MGIAGLFSAKAEPSKICKTVEEDTTASDGGYTSGGSTTCESDCEVLGSDSDLETDWKSLDEYSNMMELKFQEMAPKSPPQKYGHSSKALLKAEGSTTHAVSTALTASELERM